MNNAERRSAAIAAALFAGTAILYGLSLARVPPYLSHDEVVFSLNAHAVAASGRDVNGRLLPLFFQINSQFWATPVVIYATAAVLTLVPLGEATIRGVSVAVGALDVALVFLFGLRLFRRAGPAVVAAILLALTPAHLIHTRMAVDLIFPLPFLLAGALLFSAYVERREAKSLVAAASVLGIGCYSYLGAMPAMPIFLALGCLLAGAEDPRPWRMTAIACAAFAWPLLLLVPWLLAHPSQFAGEMRMYNVYDAAMLTPLQGLRGLIGYSSVTARAAVYYEFFNPLFLFVSGDPSLMNSTRAAGVFLLPLLVLLPVGLNALINGARSFESRFVAAGFFLAPLAALVVAEVKINRALILLPFAALAAAAGADRMLGAKRAVWRIAAVALLAAVALQFASFYRDYLGDYRSRAAFWFEQNKRGAFEEILRRDDDGKAARVYLSRTPRWIDWYWKWYLAKAHRAALLERTVYVLPSELEASAMPPGSVVFGEAEEIERARVFAGAHDVSRITEPNGTVSFIVFGR